MTAAMEALNLDGEEIVAARLPCRPVNHSPCAISEPSAPDKMAR